MGIHPERFPHTPLMRFVKNDIGSLLSVYNSFIFLIPSFVFCFGSMLFPLSVKKREKEKSASFDTVLIRLIYY